MYVPLIAVPACPSDVFVVRDVLTITRPGFNKMALRMSVRKASACEC